MDASAPIRTGDSVVLNSGGPRMTVTHVHDRTIALCIWPASPHTEYQATFPVICLTKISSVVA